VLLTWPLNLTLKQPHGMQEALIGRKYTLQDTCQHRAACQLFIRYCRTRA
jgi:hypothetical protein